MAYPDGILVLLKDPDEYFWYLQAMVDGTQVKVKITKMLVHQYFRFIIDEQRDKKY